MTSLQRFSVSLAACSLAFALAAAGCGGGGGSDKSGSNNAAVSGEDEGAADKVTCAVDGDCDSDEVCKSGLCTGIADPCSSNADCESDEVCTNGNCV